VLFIFSTFIISQINEKINMTRQRQALTHKNSL